MEDLSNRNSIPDRNVLKLQKFDLFQNNITIKRTICEIIDNII